MTHTLEFKYDGWSSNPIERELAEKELENARAYHRHFSKEEERRLRGLTDEILDALKAAAMACNKLRAATHEMSILESVKDDAWDLAHHDSDNLEAITNTPEYQEAYGWAEGRDCALEYVENGARKINAMIENVLDRVVPATDLEDIY